MEAADAAKEDASQNAGWETIYEVEPPDLVDTELSQQLWKLSTELTGAAWQPAYQPKSPCPTLVVIGAITKVIRRSEPQPPAMAAATTAHEPRPSLAARRSPHL
jgi:hypothetical protein